MSIEHESSLAERERERVSGGEDGTEIFLLSATKLCIEKHICSIRELAGRRVVRDTGAASAQ